MPFNYAKLLGRIKEYGYTQETLSKEIGMSESTLSQKLNGKFAFKQNEIIAICNILDLEISDIGVYFYVC